MPLISSTGLAPKPPSTYPPATAPIAPPAQPMGQNTGFVPPGQQARQQRWNAATPAQRQIWRQRNQPQTPPPIGGRAPEWGPDAPWRNPPPPGSHADLEQKYQQWMRQSGGTGPVPPELAAAQQAEKQRRVAGAPPPGPWNEGPMNPLAQRGLQLKPPAPKPDPYAAARWRKEHPWLAPGYQATAPAPPPAQTAMPTMPMAPAAPQMPVSGPQNMQDFMQQMRYRL